MIKIQGPCTKSFVKTVMEFHASRTAMREFLMNKKYELEEKREMLQKKGESAEKVENELLEMFDDLHDVYSDFALYFTMMRALYSEDNHKIAVGNVNKLRTAAKEKLWDNEEVIKKTQSDVYRLINRTRHEALKKMHIVEAQETEKQEPEAQEQCANCGEDHEPYENGAGND